MSTPAQHVPKCCLHRASGQAVVRLNGQDHYLGRFGTPESQARYNQLIAEWLAAERQPPRPDPNDRCSVTINEVFLPYWSFVQTYYRKNGQPTSEVASIRYALQPLLALYGSKRADEFGPLSLKAYRQHLIERGLARGHINRAVGRAKRFFKWAVENEIIPPGVLHGLQAVAGLRRGRTAARETEPVPPVPDAHVDAVLPIVRPQIAAMIQLQRLTGMRPGEVTIMRGRDLETTGKIWIYRPESHKTEHHGKKRLIYMGPQAQELLKRWLKPDLAAYLFSARDSIEAFHRSRSASRRTPMTPSQAKRQRKVRPLKTPGDHYITCSYAQAISRACAKAFPPPPDLTTAPQTEMEKQTANRLAKLRQWRRDHHWHPNQLRHNAATFLRKQYGLDAARVILGHNSPVVTEVYAELDHAKAMQIMAEVG